MSSGDQCCMVRVELFFLPVHKNYKDNSITKMGGGKTLIYFNLCFSLEMPKAEFHTLANVKHSSEQVSLETRFHTYN